MSYAKQFVNYNKHSIRVATPEGVVDLPPCGVVATVTEKDVAHGTLGGVPVVRKVYGEVVGLPKDRPTIDLGDGAERLGPIWAIVNAMVLAALRATHDERATWCVAPDTGPTAVRFPKGDDIPKEKQGQVDYVTRWVTAIS